MTKFGNGTFKYISGWYDPAPLVGNVAGTYDGRAKNVQLVISHGCRPFTQGAWCSPGFWKNAEAGGSFWQLQVIQPNYGSVVKRVFLVALLTSARPVLALDLWRYALLAPLPDLARCLHLRGRAAVWAIARRKRYDREYRPD